MYDPTLGRFIQRDPAGFDAGDGNLYAYVAAHPTAATDASGAISFNPAWVWCALTCQVTSITVQQEPGTRAVASKAGLAMYWQVTIKGTNLKRCEYAQFISNNTSLWDNKGTALTEEQVLKAYETSKIRFEAHTHPFAKNELDWGWDEFRSDTTEEISDKHRLPVPFYMEGEQKRYYPYKESTDADVQVRDKALHIVVKEHKWGYEFRTYRGEAPKAPVTTNADVGIYSHYGAEKVPFQLTNKKK